MKTETLIDFWRSIFNVVKERQEQGLPTTYKDVIFYDLGLVNIRFNSIPDLVGVDVDDEIVYEFLRRSMVPKDVRFDADLQDITMPGEIWETIPGFSRYKVSTFGRVWSTYHGKVMAPQMSKKRYQALLLRPDDGEPRRVYVHRLVAQVFIPNPEGCDTVDHIDENHINNHVSNLRWVTSRENMELYMKNHGYWYNQDAWHPGKEPKRYACPSDTEFEKWMNCINYPDYFVSDQGKVWSIYSGPKVVSCGSVALCSGGRMVNTSVRQLVAAAFLPPKEEGQVLRYRNGDKTDIRACNLYWAHPYRPKSHKRGRPKRDPGALLISNSTSLKTTPPIAEPRKVTPKEKKSL